jgi:hypothetical protein
MYLVQQSPATPSMQPDAPLTGAEMVYWFKSDTHISQSGGKVFYWDNVATDSPQNNITKLLTQSIVDMQPHYDPGAFNGYPGVRFHSSFLLSSGSFSCSNNLSPAVKFGNIDVFVVCKFHGMGDPTNASYTFGSNGKWGRLFEHHKYLLPSNGHYGFLFSQSAVDIKYCFYPVKETISGYVTQSGIVANQIHVLHGYMTGATGATFMMTASMDGGATTGTPGGNGGFNTAGWNSLRPLTFGAMSGSIAEVQTATHNKTSCSIAEVITYRWGLTPGERELIINGLKVKYGLLSS